jgi:cytochrome bd-type quinol oxidase subunit 2
MLLMAVILVLIGGAMGLAVAFDTNAPIAAATAAVGVVTFFGMLGAYGETPPSRDERHDRIRDATAVTFIVVYVVLLGLLAFAKVTMDEQAPEIASTLVTNFTALMTVVIAFYFGSTTYEKVRGVNVRGVNDVDADDVPTEVVEKKAPRRR